MTQKRELTDKQQSFIQEYVRSGDAVEATRFAGYSLQEWFKLPFLLIFKDKFQYHGKTKSVFMGLFLFYSVTFL